MLNKAENAEEKSKVRILNMTTFLDLLIVVFMVIAALSLLALCLMFLVKKPVIRKVCFYIVVALGVCAAVIGARMGLGAFFFPVQAAVAILAGLAGIGALVLQIVGRKSEKFFLAARIIAAAALVVGILNAFIF